MNDGYEGEIWASVAQVMKAFGAYLNEKGSNRFIIRVPAFTVKPCGMVLVRKGRQMVHEYIMEAIPFQVLLEPYTLDPILEVNQPVPWRYSHQMEGNGEIGDWLRNRIR